MKVLFCGPRTWRYEKLVRREIRKLPKDTIVVHGGASGADTYADFAARDMGLVVRQYLAKWDQHGKAAGPIRNKQMIDEEHPDKEGVPIDRCIAFAPDRNMTKGTRDMVRRSLAAGIPATLVFMDGTVTEITPREGDEPVEEPQGDDDLTQRCRGAAMIDPTKLAAVTRIIAHDNCADGLVSAILAKDALPSATIEFMQHNSEAHTTLTPKAGMLFADFAPNERTPGDVQDVIVLDHHRTARPIVESYVNSVFGDENTQPGVCGATLVYEHVWKPLRGDSDFAPFVAQFARLAGVRDTWQRRDTQWHESGVQHATLMFMPSEFWLGMSLQQIASQWDSRFRWIGEVQVRKYEERISKVMVESHRFTTPKGTRVACFEGVRLSSDAAERFDKDVDLVIGFSYRVEDGLQAKVILSTRSHTDYDCAAFARAHGGGGHTKAAGCSIAVAPGDLNPYAYIAQLIIAYETA